MLLMGGATEWAQQPQQHLHAPPPPLGTAQQACPCGQSEGSAAQQYTAQLQCVFEKRVGHVSAYRRKGWALQPIPPPAHPWYFTLHPAFCLPSVHAQSALPAHQPFTCPLCMLSLPCPLTSLMLAVVRDPQPCPLTSFLLTPSCAPSLQISDAGAVALAKAAKGALALSRLNLSLNNTTDTTLLALADALRFNTGGAVGWRAPSTDAHHGSWREPCEKHHDSIRRMIALHNHLARQKATPHLWRLQDHVAKGSLNRLTVKG